jgi:DNA polymerase I-like protein with 3'-5' exonuclease and polymerase domains
MAGLTDGEYQSSDSLFAATNVPAQSEKKVAGQVQQAFFMPGTYPLDYVAPDYRSIVGRSRIGLDIEGLDPDLEEKGPGAYREEGFVCGVAVAYSEDDASYYPVAHDHEGANVKDPEAFWNQFREEAKDFEGEIVGANLQYDLDWLRARHGVKFNVAKIRDIQIAEPLLNENRFTYALKALAKDYLKADKSDDELKRLYGSGYIKHMPQVHPGHAAVYGEADTTLPWRIYDKQAAQLEVEGLTDLFHMEANLMPLLLEMRNRGVRVDVDAAHEGLDMTNKVAQESKDAINQIAGHSIDIWSSDSIAKAFDALKLAYPQTTTGKPSFVKAWLASHDHDIAKRIMQAREYDKIGGTFIQNYILNGQVDGRIHAMFNQLKSDENGTVSGRFSSSSPNLQNIPARHPILGPLLRSMFIPEEGMLWGSLDWSQIEYRLLVHYASITKGIDADEAVRMYRADAKTDFHDMAAKITGLERKAVKAINFGVVYGMGIPTLAGNMGVSIAEATSISNQFHTNSPYIKGMLDLAGTRAGKLGEIRTILGRKRRFNTFEVSYYDSDAKKVERELVDEDDLAAFVDEKGDCIRNKRRAFTHKALNALLQGSAADLMKKAMVDMWDAGLFNVLVPHLTVHDEFNSSVPDTKEGREAFAEMRDIMEHAIKLDIPVLADGSLGKNWDEAK